MSPRGARRITVDDYEVWMVVDAPPPAGLCELAQRIGAETGGSA